MAEEPPPLVASLQIKMRKDICMKTIWASFPAISLDWIDEWRDCLVFHNALGSWMILVFVDKPFLWKLYQICLETIFLQESLKSTGCGTYAASQIKWLGCVFTSVFGDISMTIQAKTLLRGEGWRCPFTQERTSVIHQPGRCPFSTDSPDCLALTTPVCHALSNPLSTSLYLLFSPSLYFQWIIYIH